MKSSELHRLILKNGWQLLRVAGSHYIYEKDGVTYPAPYHGAKEVGKGIEKKIRKEMGLKQFPIVKIKNSMKSIKIVIEKSKDFYWAFAENKKAISAGGETVEDAKNNILENIEINKELGNIPNEPYELIFKYDVESFLNYYKGILSNPAIEKITGINQKQIHHYATGLKKPRPAQRKKIEEGLHKLGKELLAIELE